MTKLELAKMIDHTLLKPNATAQQIKTLCDEAKEYHFCSVCVNSGRAALAKECLAGSDVKLCVVVEMCIRDRSEGTSQTSRSIGSHFTPSIS